MNYFNSSILDGTDVLPLQKYDCDHNLTFGWFLVVSMHILYIIFFYNSQQKNFNNFKMNSVFWINCRYFLDLFVPCDSGFCFVLLWVLPGIWSALDVWWSI